MVRKRVKRKTTAASGAGAVESNEKSPTQVYNEDSSSVTPVTTPDRDVSRNDFEMYLKGRVHPVSDKSASEKVTTVFSSALSDCSFFFQFL